MPFYLYDPPERFVAGAVGQPGERSFYLQATDGNRVTSVALEKFQVSQLAERLDELLDEVLRRTGGRTNVPATTPADLSDDAPLDLPLMEEFRVGAIALAWDGEDGRVVIEAQEETENPVEPLAEEVPAVRAAAGRGGPHLPTAERSPGRRCLNRPPAGARSARPALSARPAAPGRASPFR